MTRTTTIEAIDQGIGALPPLPRGFQEVSRRRVAVDGVPALLVRNERADGRNRGLGGEHVSWLHDDRGTLKGFVRLERSLARGALPTEAVARDVALGLLRHAAPDLLDGLELHWIARHDEEITITDGAETTRVVIGGTKVKMRNPADGRWFWVIVGADGAPMVFERDIVWITMPGHRGTEKWLHDAWLAARTDG